MKACWPWSHDWSKWTDTNELTLSRQNGTTAYVFIIQERRCEKCGELQSRRVSR